LGFELLRRLLGAVRGHQRFLNFATLLVAELQWRLGLCASGEFVRLNRRRIVLCCCEGGERDEDRAQTEHLFHVRPPFYAGTTASSRKRSLEIRYQPR